MSCFISRFSSNAFSPRRSIISKDSCQTLALGGLQRQTRTGHEWCTMIPACGRLSQEDHKFKASLGYVRRPSEDEGACVGLCSHWGVEVMYILCSGSLRNYSMSLTDMLEKKVESQASSVRQAMSHSRCLTILASV